MEGTIEVKSTFKKGTELTVSLPVEAVETTNQGRISPPRTNNGLRPLAGKVLVAEDNLLNQQILRMQLGELDLDFVMVSNGAEAFEYLENHSDIQLVLTDIHMPILDGHQLVAKMKSHADLRALPVVGVTAEDSRIANRQASQSGMNEVLLKPYDLSQLHDAISRYLPSADSILPDWLARFDASERLNISKVFIRSMAADLEIIVDGRDRASVKKALHSTKGASAAVGLHRIASTLASVEKAENKDFEIHKPELIQMLSQEINSVENWIAHNEQ